MRLLKKFNKSADRILKIIVVIAFALMTVLIFGQVVFRYVIQHSLSFSEELARYLFIWITFLGASVAIRDKAHIKVSLFVNLIKSEKVKKVFLILADLLSAFLLIIFVVHGFNASFRILSFGQTSPTMDFLKIGFVYFAIPAGSFLMVMNIIEDIFAKLVIEGGDY